MRRRAALKLLGMGGALWGLAGSVARGRPALGGGEARPEPVKLIGHRSLVFSAAFDREGARIATGSLDQTLAIWDAATGLERPTFYHDGPVYAVAFSPDGTRVASGAPGRRIEHDPPPMPPGQLVAPRRWGVNFHYEGGAIRLWDFETGRAAMTIGGLGYWPRALAFAADGRAIAALDIWDVFTLHDVGDGREICLLDGHRGQAQSGTSATSAVAFTADARRAVAIKTRARKNHRGADEYRSALATWDVATKRTRMIEPEGGTADSVALSPDGDRIAVGSHGGVLTLRDFEGGAVLRTIKFETRGDPESYNSPYFLSFSPDGKRLAVARQNQPLTIHDGATGALLQTIDSPPGVQKDVRAIAFGKGWVRVVTGGLDNTQERDPETGILKPEPLLVWQSPLD
ncbi:MAG: hypothetical protein IRY99_10615 [Isosphaeraceae bacterium]|nr:hypothetical protein [Isosphaeraceae bacterium]